MKTASENVLRALAAVIANARAGSVGAVAIVTVTPSGPQVSFAGDSDLLAGVNLGLDMLKGHLIASISQPEKQPVTPLVRAASIFISAADFVSIFAAMRC